MKDYSLDTYSGKTVLITGDTGFKGSWLSIWLLKLGANVIGFGLPPFTPDDNFVVTDLKSRITHIDGDIRNFELISEVFENNQPDYIFHLAAQALVLDSYRDPHYTYTTNVVGTLNVLEAIRKHHGIKAAVMVTSDKCYETGKGDTNRFCESDPLGGNDPYSASKGAAEIVITSYIRSFFNNHSPPAIASVRAGNVFGGGDWAKNRIVPDCIRALQKEQPVIIRNPHAIRPWQFVLEPLYGYLLLGIALTQDAKTFSGPWNFGPHFQDTVSVETLVKEIIHQWGSGSYQLDIRDTSFPESPVLMLDINKATHILRWSPCLTLQDAIKLTLSEYRVAGLSKQEIFKQRVSHIDEYMKIREVS